MGACACSGPFDLCATYATTTRKKKLGQQPQSPDPSVVRLSLQHTAIDPRDPDERWRLGSDRLMIGVYDQESIGADKAVGVGVVHLSQVKEHWGEYAWLNLYGLPNAGGDGFFAWASPAFEQLGQAWAKVSDKQKKLLENRDMVRKGELPGTVYTGRIKVRLEWRGEDEPRLLDMIPCCSADGGAGAPAAQLQAAGDESASSTQVGFRFRSLLLQAGSLQREGTYSVELSCGAERVESLKLRSDGTCVNWWNSDVCRNSGHGTELEPLDYRQLSIHDITQVPDVFISLKRGSERVGYVRLNPESLASGEDLSFEIAEWHALHRDPEGPVPEGGDPGSVLMAVSIEPIFSRGHIVDSDYDVDSALGAGRVHRKRKPTAPRRRSAMSPSRSPQRHDASELSMLDATRDSEISIQEDRRAQVEIEQQIRDKKRTLRMLCMDLERRASTQLDVTVVEAKGLKDTVMFGSAAGQYFAEVTIGTPGGVDRIRRKTLPSASPGADPIWDSNLRYDVTDAATAKLTARVLSRATGKEDRLLGSTEAVGLQQVLRDRAVDGWWPLYLDDSPRGEVFLRVSAHGEEAAPPSEAVDEVVVDKHRTKLRELEEELAHVKSRLRTAGHISASPSRHNWTPSLVGAAGAAAPVLTRYMLDVHIYQARHLPPAGADGTTNAFVRAEIGNEVRDTVTRRASLFPRWYETLHFEVDLPKAQELVRVWSPQLVLSLLHMPDSMMTSTPELLGKLNLEIDPAMAGEPAWETFTMYNQTTEESRPVSADLLLSYELTEAKSSKGRPAAATRPQQHEMTVESAEHTVSLLVIGCRGLQPTDTISTPVPELTFKIPNIDPEDDDPEYVESLAPSRVEIEDKKKAKGKEPEYEDHTDIYNPTYSRREDSEDAWTHMDDILDMDARLPAQLFAPTLVATVAGSSLGRSVTIGTATINLADFMDGGCKTAAARKERKEQREIDRALARSSELVTRRSGGASMSALQSTSRTPMPTLESYRVDDLEYGSVSRDSTASLMEERSGKIGRSDSTSEDSDDENSDADETEVASRGQGASEPPKWDWRQGRKVLRTGLETWLNETPVVSFPLYCKPAKRKDGGGTDPALQAACGVLKAALVVSPPNAPTQPQQLQEFKKVSERYFQEPKKVTVFLYVVRAMHLPSDGAGGGTTKCDARLRVRLQGQFKGSTILPSDVTQHSLKEGGLVYDDSPQVKAVDGAPASSTDDTLNPYFGQLYQVETVLPGASRLSIELYDHKDISEKVKTAGWTGEEIGATILDLEDRYFSSNWTGYCKGQHQRNKSNAHAPIETRTLRRAGFALPRGQLELWVDIFDSADVDAGRRGRLETPQYRAFRREPEPFELRVAVMEARNMHPMEGDRNDLKFSAEVFTHKGDATLQGTERKSTDTHRKTRHGSFNQWIRFKDLQLYHPVPTISPKQRQRQRLLLKAWDADTFTADDLIGSYDSAVVSASRGRNAVFDVDKLFERAMFEISKVKDPAADGKKRGRGKKGARKFGKNHVFRLPDSHALAKQKKGSTGGGGSAATKGAKAAKSCCSKCFGRGTVGRTGPEPQFVPITKQMGHSRAGSVPVPEQRGEVKIHLELLPKQLAEDGKNEPKEMDKPLRETVSWGNPLGALSFFLPFNLSADLLPCGLGSCVCYTLVGLFVLIFMWALLSELPKVLIQRAFGGE